MVHNIIMLGDKLMLTRYDNYNNKSENKQYISTVLDCIDNDILHIAMPIENNQLIPLSIGEQLGLCFYSKKGIYQSEGIVKERLKEGNAFLCVVQLTEELIKIQRRQYYRLQTLMDIYYREYSEEEINYKNQLKLSGFVSVEEQIDCYNHLNDLKREFKPAILTDISGGGARFNCADQLKKGQYLKLKLTLNTKGGEFIYVLEAVTIASIKLLNKTNVYENHIEFSNIDIKQRETIIRFVFEEDRKQRRREKGLI